KKTTSSTNSSASGNASSSSSEHTGAPGHHVVGGDYLALILLADLSKQSVKDLHSKYPQQTAWQIAKKTNVLDQLKHAYLEKQQQRIRTMQTDGRLSQEDGSRIYQELAQNVSKIDGEKVVTVGHIHF
ncbi:MAG TPA: hypothetical protein DEP42_06730, partial [Ruminococcaceae bacterium]|nr:hypothetical protein [Oscillospiraceae bacterium]